MERTVRPSTEEESALWKKRHSMRGRGKRQIAELDFATDVLDQVYNSPEGVVTIEVSHENSRTISEAEKLVATLMRIYNHYLEIPNIAISAIHDRDAMKSFIIVGENKPESER